tara:strand:+ start:259 stop:567 length:309 start_codon:yes stop_codon:yes gene_type:complete
MTNQEKAIKALTQSVIRQRSDDLRDGEDTHPYWDSVLEALQDLRLGNYQPEDLLAFTVYQSCENLLHRQDFLEAFGHDIGVASGCITQLSGALRDSINREAG